MHENKRQTPPMGGPKPAENAKDFKGSLKRLFHELDIYKVLIYIAFVLA